MVLLDRIFSPLLFSIAILSQSSSVSALGITDLFQVSFDSSVPGNCAAYNQATLDGLVQDAVTLAKAGQSAAEDAISGTGATPDEADRLISAFFISPSDKDKDTVRKRYKAVSQWLRKGGPVVYQQISAKPYLFCGDSWAIRYQMSDQMFDVNGKKMEKPDKTPFLISDDSDAVKKQAAEAAARNVAVSDIYPYYSERAGIYTFGPKYSDDPDPGYCKHAGALGFTEWSVSSGSSFMVLCPNSFTNVALRSVKAAPVISTVFENNPSTFPVPVQEIKAVVPAAQTLFHECFHLLLGDRMDPSGGEEYDALRMMGVKSRTNGRRTYRKSSALQNPQSYTFAAIAYDYTQKEQFKSKPVEFYTGYCSYES